MSYDLAVFDPDHAPRDREAFLEWYAELTDWKDHIDYNQPDNASPKLRAWFDDMILEFPPLNGPLADPLNSFEEPSTETTDYSIDEFLIDLGFRWSLAERAYDAVLSRAQKHGVGFFDVSSSELDIVFPGETPAHSGTAKKAKAWFDGRVEEFRKGKLPF